MDSGVGIYAPDAEAYSVFSALFDPLIEDYHKGFSQSDKHPDCDFGDVDSLQNLDPEGEYVISTRVRGGRSLEVRGGMVHKSRQKTLPLGYTLQTERNHFKSNR